MKAIEMHTVVNHDKRSSSGKELAALRFGIHFILPMAGRFSRAAMDN
jgi:hypothetical protein